MNNKPILFVIVLIGFVSLLMLQTQHLAADVTHSYYGFYRNEWRDAIYPNSQSDDNANCQLCHVNAGGGNPWNAYGWSIREALRGAGSPTFAQAVAAVETLDSDGNGDLNLVEITADAQPGWTDADANTHYFSDGTVLENQPPPSIATVDPEPTALGLQSTVASTRQTALLATGSVTLLALLTILFVRHSKNTEESV